MGVTNLKLKIIYPFRVLFGFIFPPALKWKQLHIQDWVYCDFSPSPALNGHSPQKQKQRQRAALVCLGLDKEFYSSVWGESAFPPVEFSF